MPVTPPSRRPAGGPAVGVLPRGFAALLRGIAALLHEIAPPVRELGLDLLALLWPTSCVACGAADRDCCDACLARVREPEILRCEMAMPAPVYAASRYSGPVRDMLIAYKHAGRTVFARHLATRLRPALLAAAAHAGPGRPLLAVAVPSRPGRVRERGYRHVDELVRRALRERRGGADEARADGEGRRGAERERRAAAGGAGEAHRGSMRAGRGLRRRGCLDEHRVRLVRALRPLRGRRGQVGLDSAQRVRNAALLALRRSSRASVRGAQVIVVDDIVTTGASLRAACAVLERGGATVVGVVALCAVERLDAAANGEEARAVTSSTNRARARSPDDLRAEDRGLAEGCESDVATPRSDAIGFVKGVMVRPREATRLRH